MDTNPRRNLRRSITNRMIGGVCGGLADYLEVDPTSIRLLFVAFAFVGGSGIILYLVLWMVMPEEISGTMPKGNGFSDSIGTFASNVKSNVSEGVSTLSRRGRMLFASALILLGGLWLAQNLFPQFSIRKFWPLVLVALGIWLIWQSRPPVEEKGKEGDDSHD